MTNPPATPLARVFQAGCLANGSALGGIDACFAGLPRRDLPLRPIALYTVLFPS